MPATRWTSDLLDRMRTTGDPLADAAIQQVFAEGDLAAVQRVLDTLTRNDQIVHAELPPVVRDYFASLPHVPEPEKALAAQGQRVFTDYGPEILMVLACYSLPAAYAARKGVQVLYRTGYLSQRTNLRLFQTSQMVIDVMTPGGLGPAGRGRVTAQKIRLMHAAIRHLLVSNRDDPWPTEDFGLPINQEDLAGTLMTFTHLVHDGLSKLGVIIDWPPGYLDTWKVVAHIMGIADEMIPDTPEEAAQLCAIIQARQVAPSAEGRALTVALLSMLEHYTLPPFKGMPAALMRHFLPHDVADFLGVPPHRLDELLVKMGVGVERVLGRTFGVELEHLRRFGTDIVELLVKAEMGGRRPTFRIPTELQDAWELSRH